MFASFFRAVILTLFLLLCPASAQPAWLQPGSHILANPMGMPGDFHPAQVLRYDATSDTYRIRFTSGPYAVGKGEYTLSASKLQQAPTPPPQQQTQQTEPVTVGSAPSTASSPTSESANEWLRPGNTVMATPMNFPDDFHPAQILSYDAQADTYRVRFTSGPYAIGQGEYQLSASRLRPNRSVALETAPPPARPTPAPVPTATTVESSTPPPATNGTEPKAAESTWEAIWKEREATIAAQQQQAAQPAGPVGGAKPFQGLYLRHEQSFQGTALNYREDHYYFFADGRVYHDVPPEGPARFDWNKAIKESPELCGYYGVNGNEITFSWQGGGYTWVLKKNGGGYEMNYSPTVKVDAFPPNARLSGTYQRGDVTIAAGAPTLSTAFSYTFYPDGTLSLNEMKGTDSPNVTTTVRDRDNGTYSLSGNDLEVRTGAGVWRCTAYPQWDNGAPSTTPRRLSLDGALLERR